MKICREIEFEDLKKECWGGAIKTLKIIEESGKEKELMHYLDMTFVYTPSLKDINDWLRDGTTFIFGALGIENEEEFENGK